MVLTIGFTGKFTFKSPVNNVLDEDLEYEITSIRRITEVFVNEEVPYDTIYVPLSIAKEQYNLDFIANVNIIGLKSSRSTDYVYVPETYISSTPIITGVKYVEKILAINLGKVPLTLSLDNLTLSITELIKENTNLNTTVLTIENSGIELVTEIDHQIYMNKINYMGNKQPTYRELYFELKEKYDALWKVTDNLNNAIKLTLTEE